MIERNKIIKYIVVFGTILIFFILVWFNKIYYNIKSADKMLHISLNIFSKSDIFDKFEVFMISPKGKIKLFLKDEENKKYYIDFGSYINKIKLIVNSNIKSEINVLLIKIGNKSYQFNDNDLKNRWKEDNDKSIIVLEDNDFKGLKKSIIPVFSKIINWPGGYSFFSINYFIYIFIIIASIGIIIFFIDIFIKKYFLFLLNNKNINLIISFLIPIIIFNITYFQRPIYRSNQHTKFIHGLAKAGYGFLNNDWLANTVDPLPAFSFIVSITYKYFHEYFFYLYQSILFGIFICSILGISFCLFKIKDSKIKIFILFSLIILFHSQLFHSIFIDLFGFSVLEIFYEDGVADQYLLGSFFQPCVFGVFILVSIYYFLKNKPYIAVIFSAIATIFHTGYILFSGLLTLSYILIILKDERDIKKAFLVGLLSLILVSPILIYDKIFFKATSPENLKTAYDIIVNKRIPHHTDPRIWVDWTVFVKMIIISLALFIIRKKKIFIIILLPFLIGIIFTLIKLFTNSTLIGFLTPWRVSVFLVPLSTTIILAFTVSYIFNNFGNIIYKKEFLVKMICYVAILIPLLFGLNVYIERFNFYLNKKLDPIESFVFKNKSPNDNYLIPVDYMEFRINTGTPVFVTKKSHPYKDIEIIEWDERINIADEFYNSKNILDKCNMLILLKRKYGITNVVLQSNQFDWNLGCLEELYKDSINGVYKIKE